MFLTKLVLFTLQVQAFTLMTQDMKGWNAGTVNFRLNPTGCTVSNATLEASINKAVDLWNSVPTSKLKLSYGGITSDTGQQAEPVIECDTAFGSSSTVGVGGVATQGGVIVSGRIRLNAQSGSAGDIGTKNTTTLEIVMAHEMGHVLGIGHTPAEEALMHYSVAQKTNLNLAQDDMDAISYLYPRSEPANGDAFGCGTIAPPGGDFFEGIGQWSMLGLCMALSLLPRLFVRLHLKRA